jgi:hypothetical protein
MDAVIIAGAAGGDSVGSNVVGGGGNVDAPIVASSTSDSNVVESNVCFK